MTATTWRHGRRLAGLLGAALVLAQCSAVPLASASQPPPPANYAALVAGTLRGIKGFSGFSDFQVSGLRWVHSAYGWTWLACVRFTDRGRQHFYAFFLDAGGVVSSRYDVRTDRCAAQPYAPLDMATGSIAAPLPTQPQAAGAPPPSFTLQQPIY
jgi:hypothetical protein